MNRRVKKKIDKRVGIRKYSEFKRHRLIRVIKKLYPDTGMIVVETSRSGRSVKRIAVCSNIIPVSTDRDMLAAT